MESKFIHDCKCCSCGSVGVNGGLKYVRMIGNMNWRRMKNKSNQIKIITLILDFLFLLML
ncbi:DUF7695 domain-containing protein [Bacillus thuringiensis]|uniref:DUF7695 domain-containing protein n=1 Tax=Bacillus thuringiensis TaxID=1428 RepID=UPI001E55FE31|nr:hypothetical protein [Bacillus thuringiensis]